jgi:SAM-dependent methyltransferase
MQIDKAAHYNSQYRKQNYFGYSEWIYDRYISSLILTCHLKEGSSVLDVGCGQGFFSYLFRKHGMNVYGIDISEVGIGMAANIYGHLGINFAVADIETVVFPEQFDCVFVRSCSLYNRSDFSENDEVTSKLLRHVRPSGVLIFLHNSNFSSRRSDSWRYHSWKDLKKHFIRYPNTKMCFSIKIDACFLGRYAFTAFITRVNMILSKVSRIGGDLICILKNPVPRP